MEELRKTALAYYENLPEDGKNLAKEFFKSMDVNKDGKISLREYAEFLGCLDLNRPEIFKELDKDGNGSLDFDEVITLFYIVNTGRLIFCDECRAFVKGVYFTCVQCFSSNCNTYDLCCNCYSGKKFDHHKDAIFCDNVALLLKSRKLIADAPTESKNKVFTAIKTMVQIVNIATAVTAVASCSIM